MSNTFSNKFFIISLGCIIGSFFAVSLFVSFSNRIEGDAAFHALISREIAESGNILNATSYMIGTEKNNFPVAYPQVFHLIGALTYLYIGTPTFSLLPVFYGGLSLYFLAVIFFNLHKHATAIFIGILILALNLYFLDYSSKYFMEIGLVFAILAALAYSIKYINQRKISNLYVAAIFFGLSVAIKQQGLIALPVFLIVLNLCFRWGKSLKPIVISFILFIFVAAGPMLQLFSATGSILYPGDNPPKIIQLLENPLRNMLHIQLLEGDKTWGLINEGRREEELLTWRSLPNTVTAWLVQENSASVPWVYLTGILLFILLVRVIKTRNTKDFVMLIFLTLFYCLLYFLARPRYALPLIVLPSVTLFYIIYTLSSVNIKRPLIVFTAAFFIIYTMINFSSKFSDILFRDDYGYYGRYNTNRQTELQSLYDPIKNDTGSSFTVLSPVPYETAYYTKHPSVWANPYGAIDLFDSFLGAPENEVITMLKKYRVKYLIVYDDRYMRYSNWAGINPNDGFFSTIDTSDKFRLVKSNPSGKVYTVNY
jgi:hypothetical protein